MPLPAARAVRPRPCRGCPRQRPGCRPAGSACGRRAQRGPFRGVIVIERFPLTPEGWVSAWRALVKLDAVSAQRVLTRLNDRAAMQRKSGVSGANLAASMRDWQQQEDAERQARQAKRRKESTDARERSRAAFHLRALGVAVFNGEVYREEPLGLRGRLGSLAGAHAEVTGGQSGRRRSGAVRANDAVVATVLLGPVGLLAGASRKAVRGTAFVIFADGTVHEASIPDQASLVRAQTDAVRFNTLAGGASPAAPETGDDFAGKLRKLRELRDEGLLSQEEYESKRAAIIDSI